MNIFVYKSLLKNGYIKPESKNYLWLPEMEFISTKESSKRIEIYKDIINFKDMTLFAINGGGDFFAWHNDDIVYFIDCCTGEGTAYASNLEGAIYRRILEFSCGDYVEFCTNEEKIIYGDDSEFFISEDEATEMLIAYRNGFGMIFKNEWLLFIDNMIQKGFFNGNSFISYEKSFDTIKNSLGFDKINQKIDFHI